MILEFQFPVFSKESLLSMSVSEWLSSLCLAADYAESFESNFFGSMERVEAVWDDELVRGLKHLILPSA